MIDPKDYFGPPPEKAPPKTEEKKIAAFKAIKTKLAAADPAADINHVVRQAQKKADQSKNISTKIRHLGLAIGDIENLKTTYQLEHQTDELHVGSEDYFIALDYFLAADLATIQLRQAIAHLELAAETEADPEASSPVPERVPPACQSQFPDQMDAEQVALYIHRNLDVVYRYAREGKLPAQYIDTHPLFSKKDIDEWLASQKKRMKVADTRMLKERAKREVAFSTPLAEPNPRTRAIVDKLILKLSERLRLPTTESTKLRDWLLYNAHERVGNDMINWNGDRRSLATLIVLCQHADIIHLPSTPRKNGGVGPGYSVALREGFLLDSGPITAELAESIARSHLSPIENQITAFEDIVAEVMTKLDPGLLSRHRLFSAILNYYEFIIASPRYAEYAQRVNDVMKAVDKSILRIFYDLVVEIPDLASFQDPAL